jgi:hypothetical protein
MACRAASKVWFCLLTACAWARAWDCSGLSVGLGADERGAVTTRVGGARRRGRSAGATMRVSGSTWPSDAGAGAWSGCGVGLAAGASGWTAGAVGSGVPDADGAGVLPCDHAGCIASSASEDTDR